MRFTVVYSLNEWTEHFGALGEPTTVAIGNFDGMHRGHQALLRLVVDDAHRAKLLPAVLTFDPHPAQVLRPEQAPSLLQTPKQRLRAFEEVGIEAALVLRFDEELAKMSAEDFAKNVLSDTMHARMVVVGDNFRFGHKQTGDVALLERLGRHLGFKVHIAAPVAEHGLVISSTGVRGAVREGRMEEVARMLGRPFSLAGEIQTGTGTGRKVVVPTLNLRTEQQTLPKNGVYATETVLEGNVYRSVTNVGMRPTFDGVKLTIESHLLGFHEELTSGPLEVRFLKRLRDEQKFASVDALKTQIFRDIEEAKQYFEAASSEPVR